MATVDVDMMVKAISNGSGGSTQFGIRAPMMAHRKFTPRMATNATLSYYFGMIEGLADRVGSATPLFDRAVELTGRAIEMGPGDEDNATMIEVLASMPRKTK